MSSLKGGIPKLKKTFYGKHAFIARDVKYLLKEDEIDDVKSAQP